MRIFTARVLTSGICCLGMLAACTLLSGCNKPTGTVRGKVTYKGNLIKGGYVSFTSADNGRTASAGIKEDGTYEAHQVPGGNCKVCVDTTALKPPSSPGGFKGGPPGSGPPGGGPDASKGGGPPAEFADKLPPGYAGSSPAAAAADRARRLYVQIPDAYSKPETTPLTFDVSGGDQTFDIDVK